MTAAVLLVIAAGVVGAALGMGAREDGGAAAPVSGSQDTYRGSETPGGMRLPSFALRDHTGELVRSRDLLGKVVLLTFLDSQCQDACPVIAREVALTVDALTDAEREEVEAVAISTDPAEDTPRSIRVNAVLERKSSRETRTGVGSVHRGVLLTSAERHLVSKPCGLEVQRGPTGT